MVLAYLTEITLEVTVGAAWWLTKKTASGAYGVYSYLTTYTDGTENLSEKDKEIQIIEFSDEKDKKLDIILEEMKSLRTELNIMKESKNMENIDK